MSLENATWLNTKTLIGQTAERGNAWHYRASEQGVEANHYLGEIPVEDVRRRLFSWQAVEGDVSTSYTTITEDGVETVSLTDPDRKTIVRPRGALDPNDPGGILGIFKSGYTIHDYNEWLVERVSTILHGGLAVSSAGLLRQGAVAWVEVSVPETFTTPEGVTFRPNILAATSLDGSLSSTYGRTITNTVCDNTMSAAISEMGDQKIKVRHSRYSKLRLAEARDTLSLVHTMADDFAAQVADLTATTVTDAEWGRFLDKLTPLTEGGEPKKGRALTIATNKRDTMARLWNHDQRVAPWKGTAWGVVQAVNTASHHEFTVKGDRAERNALRAVEGKIDALDQGTVKLLAAVR